MNRHGEKYVRAPSRWLHSSSWRETVGVSGNVAGRGTRNNGGVYPALGSLCSRTPSWPGPAREGVRAIKGKVDLRQRRDGKTGRRGRRENLESRRGTPRGELQTCSGEGRQRCEAETENGNTHNTCKRRQRSSEVPG